MTLFSTPRTVCLLLLLTLALGSRAQGPARAVAGTQVWLVPPAGFTATPGLPGFRRGEAVLQVYDVKGGNYYRQAAGFNQARFAARGGKVLDFREVPGAYPARLARVQLTPTQESVQLLFGDSTFAVLLDARYPAADTALATALRRSLLTATYQKASGAGPASLAGAVFGLDEKKSPFALAEIRAGQYLYTLGGQRKPDDGPEPTVTVLTLPYNPSLTAADISQQALSRRTGLAGYTARKMSSAKVNDLVTYETEGFAQLQGQRVLVYQQVSIIGSTAVALQGLARQDFEAALAQFKSLTHTITACGK
ncbi:hypothetical protein HNQ93_001463 [Hymenobacter luteus]|uniref:Uncharacterized protein n=2 Tax=Hymenobacter TaxID=89966 RepID=A0A7W9SZ60_9BACT|nr:MULTISPECIES: hypothetical protein [Hymenobacter]MBB4601176.1 hypothetical protein [Hymenobacter latericoloratus]MBB6058617.1 hypothetical protein [Hymenobacter luteus]